MSNAVFLSVVEIMSGLFSVPPESLSLESSMETVDQWDSLQHFNVILDIEQRFGIELSPEEVLELNSVGKIVEVVEKKLST